MVVEDIKVADDVLNKNLDFRYINNYFSRFYIFSNENLSGYLRDNNYDGKNALTVGSSGDQVFNLINYGCKNVTLFDINPIAKYFYNLKKACIFGLNKNEFFDFFLGYFSRVKKLSFKVRTYSKISKYLDEETKKFWDYLFNNYSSFTNLFFENSLSKKNLISNNDYLNEDFKNLRKKIEESNVDFCTGNIIKIDKIDTKYDYILLSNVFDYVFNILIKDLNEFLSVYNEYNALLDKVKLLLKENGKIYFHYVWDYNDSDYCVFYSKYYMNNRAYFNRYVRDANDIGHIQDCVLGYDAKKKVLTR